MADPPTLTLMIPTIGRPSLARCLHSVRVQDWRSGDAVILIGDGPQPVARALWDQLKLPGRYLEVPGPSADWGHTPHNLVMPIAPGDYLMALDDDDRLAPGAVATVRAAVAAHPGRPHLFRMRLHHLGGRTLWVDREVRHGNVGTPMLVAPNDPARLGRYAPRYGGDFDFIRECVAHYPGGPVWREEVVGEVRS